jgi:hypothetical protein
MPTISQAVSALYMCMTYDSGIRYQLYDNRRVGSAGRETPVKKCRFQFLLINKGSHW